MTRTTAASLNVQLLDVRQLAAALGMHPRSIWRLVAMAGHARVFSESDLQFIESVLRKMDAEREIGVA